MKITAKIRELAERRMDEAHARMRAYIDMQPADGFAHRRRSPAQRGHDDRLRIRYHHERLGHEAARDAGEEAYISIAGERPDNV